MKRLVASVLGLLLCFCSPISCMVACQAVGPQSEQKADQITDQTYGPAQTKMVDAERGTISTTGTGPTAWKRVDGQGVETISSGQVQRTLFWDGEKLVLDSGTDITATGVEIVRSPDGGISIRMDSAGTSASEPVRASNEAYDRLAELWQGYSADQREAFIAQLQAMEQAGEVVAGGLVQVLLKMGGLP